MTSDTMSKRDSRSAHLQGDLQDVFEKHNEEFGIRVMALTQLLSNTLANNLTDEDDIVEAMIEVLEPFVECVKFMDGFCNDDNTDA
tara:strand:+ start:19133 stop:19390 length:258 start_codon:yes stop_codon:yes gene_type:complete